MEDISNADCLEIWRSKKYKEPITDTYIDLKRNDKTFQTVTTKGARTGGGSCSSGGTYYHKGALGRVGYPKSILDESFR